MISWTCLGVTVCTCAVYHRQQLGGVERLRTHNKLTSSSLWNLVFIFSDHGRLQACLALQYYTFVYLEEQLPRPPLGRGFRSRAHATDQKPTQTRNDHSTQVIQCKCWSTHRTHNYKTSSSLVSIHVCWVKIVITQRSFIG